MIGQDTEKSPGDLTKIYFPLDTSEINTYKDSEGARGVMVIAEGNGFGNMSSNPGRHWLHFT